MLIVYYLTTMMCHVTKIICYIYSAIILSCFTLQKSLAQTTNIAEFLHRVAVNNERTQTFNSGVKLASTPLHTQLSNLQTPASLRQTTQIDTLALHDARPIGRNENWAIKKWGAAATRNVQYKKRGCSRNKKWAV